MLWTKALEVLTTSFLTKKCQRMLQTTLSAYGANGSRCIQSSNTLVVIETVYISQAHFKETLQGQIM